MDSLVGLGRYCHYYDWLHITCHKWFQQMIDDPEMLILRVSESAYLAVLRIAGVAHFFLRPVAAAVVVDESCMVAIAD